ncbi:DUF4259 domain-containing protein [Kitasatospora sp. Root107]|uniref:DUF4259 domain-containing protein n=1 Tax=Kitasatospora sp. Root107 TaxID=1736424 RepID=UPI00138F4EF5|nr:DUF4259 domain-containing protein [Kitasatospora sp. Root107]
MAATTVARPPFFTAFTTAATASFWNQCNGSGFTDAAGGCAGTDARTLAAEALDRVLAEESELAELWDDTVDGPRWRQSISRLRATLDPQPEPQEDPLFEI